MKIEFFIPKDESIPTQLRLRVDDTIDVYYERTDGGWVFEFFKFQGVTLEMAQQIVDKIFNRMASQSYDHGAQWREVGDRAVWEDEYGISVEVFYRVRDAG